MCVQIATTPKNKFEEDFRNVFGGLAMSPDDGENVEKVEVLGAVFQEVYKVNESVRPNHDLENRVLVKSTLLRENLQQWRSENTGFVVFNDDNMADNAIADEGVHPPFISKTDLQVFFESLKKKKSVGVD